MKTTFIFLQIIVLPAVFAFAQNESAPLLSVSSRILADKIYVGDPVEVEMTVTNEGETEFIRQISDYRTIEDFFDVTVKDETRRSLRNLEMSFFYDHDSQTAVKEIRLPPAGVLKKTIVLNYKVMIDTPGEYEIFGQFDSDPAVGYQDKRDLISSEPVKIHVLPRSAEQLAEYTALLVKQLRTAADEAAKDDIIRNLAITADVGAIPYLVDGLYEEEPSLWIDVAFNKLMSDRAAIKQEIMVKAQQRGLTMAMVPILNQLGVTQDEWKPLIKKSLDTDNPQAWQAALTAYTYEPAEEFTPRIAEISKALIKDKTGSNLVVYALTAHRTPESVNALKDFINHSDPEIRKLSRTLILASIMNRGWTSQRKGEPFRREDFSELADETISDYRRSASIKSQRPFSLSIKSVNENVKLGDPISIEFLITNQGKEEYEYRDRNYDRSGRMSEYQLTAKDPSGKSVPDPRENFIGGIGGGLSGIGKLQPGESFRKTIDLNRWALITQPARYEVIGRYFLESRGSDGGYIESPPVSIEILPRREDDILPYIDTLGKQLRETQETQKKDEIVQKLMYTADNRIIPYLIEDCYSENPSYWTTEAFNHYLKDDEVIKLTIMKAAQERGLCGGMEYVLNRLGLGREEFLPLISTSLASANVTVITSGAALAQRYPEQRFTQQLIKIANMYKDSHEFAKMHLTQTYAVGALAGHRTDEGVAALKDLLKSEDPEVRKITAEAIDRAYRYPGNTTGMPLQKDDFPEIYKYGLEYDK